MSQHLGIVLGKKQYLGMGRGGGGSGQGGGSDSVLIFPN